MSISSTRETAHSPHRTGFTLIELLVVIAIISLLLAILLPSLSSAKRVAHAVSCGATLRAIGQGMHEYAQDNEDWIVGSPAGSGAIVSGSVSQGIVSQNWDFMGPLAHTFGITLPQDRSLSDMKDRFNLVRTAGAFKCASNDFLAGYFPPGPDAGVGPMVAYNTVRYMLFEEGLGTSNTLPAVVGDNVYNNIHEQKLPSGYSPRTTRMGDPSRKVFCADGARFSQTTVAPDYDLSARALWGGAFSDVGPYSSFTRSWDRGSLFSAGSGTDARFYAFRHARSILRPNAPADAFKMNVLFFDTHVELMGDLESASPYMWLPARSKMDLNNVYPDVLAKFGLTAGQTININ